MIVIKNYRGFMDPLTGVIILAIYPIVLVGALILFGKYSKDPE